MTNAANKDVPDSRAAASLSPGAREPSTPSGDELPDRRARFARHFGMRLSRGRLFSAGVLGPLIIMWIALTISTPAFLTGQNISNLFLQASVIGVMAFGTTVVIITEEIDLSIGATVGIGAVVSAALIINDRVPWPLAVLAALLLGMMIGLVNGVMTTRVGVPSFVTTLAMLGIVTGLGLQITGGETLYGLPGGYQAIGQNGVFGIKEEVFVAIAVMLALTFTLRRTRFGLNAYAVGGNRRAARLVGISPSRVKTIAFMISGTTAALAGILEAAQLNSANGEYGSTDLLNAIAAVVIGGTALTGGRGSVVDTALGVLVIATVTNGLDLLNVSPFWQQAAIGAMILFVVILDRRNRASVSES